MAKRGEVPYRRLYSLINIVVLPALAYNLTKLRWYFHRV